MQQESLHADASLVNLLVPQGLTPLHAAMRCNSQHIVEVVTLLTQAGATADTADNTKVSCLYSLRFTRLWYRHAEK